MKDPMYASEMSSECIKVKQKRSWTERLRILEAKCGLEAQGIRRVEEHERGDQKAWRLGEFWCATNTSLPTFSAGTLGPSLLGISLKNCIWCAVFAGLTAAIVPSFFSIFGSRFGLRQIIGSRLLLGWHSSQIFAVFDILTSLGWQIVNNIAAGQIISVVCQNKIGPEIGIVITSLFTFVFGFFGYRYVVQWQRYMFLIAIVCFSCVAANSKQYWPALSTNNTVEYYYMNELALIAVYFGFIFGWAPMSSDWSLYMSSKISSKQIFWWTYIGMIIPIVLLLILGSVVMSIVTNSRVPFYEAQFDSYQLGGLLNATVYSWKVGGNLIIFLIALTTVSANVVNLYSVILSILVLSEKFAEIPQSFFALVATMIVTPISIAGAYKFQTALNIFMNFIVVWLAPYCTIYMVEHLVFRKADFKNYNVSQWQNEKEMGRCWIAMTSAFGGGFISFVFTLLSQLGQTKVIYSWSMEFGIVISLFLYISLRNLELHMSRKVQKDVEFCKDVD